MPFVPQNVTDLDALISNLEVMRREHGNKPVPPTVVTQLYTVLDFEEGRDAFAKANEAFEAAVRG